MYFLQKEREFERFSAVPDDPATLFEADPGSHGKRGRVRGTLGLTEGAYVRVYERVAVKGNSVTRLAYCYALVIDEVHIRRWERDPETHPEDPVHEHEGPDEIRRSQTDRTPLKKALRMCWKEVSLQAEAPFDDGD